MAAPTLDGTATNTFTAAATGTVTLTTTNTNDVIVVLIGFEHGGGGIQRSVTSVTASGLTFVKRGMARSGVSASFTTIECWWAPSTGALTNKVITFNLDGNIDSGSVIAFGVNGAGSITSPWDTNGSLPSTTGGTLPSATPVFSTTQANDFVFVAGENYSPNTYTSSWTTIGNSHNAAGALWSYLDAFYERVTSTQTSANASITTTGSAVYDCKYCDAITADAAVTASPFSSILVDNPIILSSTARLQSIYPMNLSLLAGNAIAILMGQACL